MLITKTEKGQEILQARCQELAIRERQALIMIDGRRTVEDIKGMFGSQSSSLLSRLLQGGFIKFSEASAQQQSDETAPGFLTSIPFAGSSLLPGAETGVSMTLAKQFLVSRLVNIKDSNTKRFINGLHACSSKEELVESMIHALMYLQSELLLPDYAELFAKLSQIVPPKYWQRIQSELA